jgi:hypothetical protein
MRMVHKEMECTSCTLDNRLSLGLSVEVATTERKFSTRKDSNMERGEAV